MAALDTNVLVRYLVRDDARQLETARALMAAAVQRGEVLWVPISVMLELEWVLRARYGFAKDDVLGALGALLGAVELAFQNESALEVALALYRQGRADFSDCVHVALAHQAGQAPLWTFDKAAAKLEGARWLTPGAPGL
ncbi:MAG: type II toxin-antitoxin system VapC family toxin [Pseudomonadota bacterium]|nr:type II toxin-antitoxin system VapC family toxin [Pseudomonadota bacterium]